MANGTGIEVTSPRTARFIMTAVLLVMVSACTAGTAATPALARRHMPAPTTPPITSSTGSSPVDAADRDAVATYRAMWADFAAAATTSNWQSPRLAVHATAYALSTMSRGLYADHYNGLVSRGAPILHPTVSSADPPGSPTKIIITDCGDDTHWLKYRASNGQLADKTPGGHRLINAVVDQQSDGSWKVTDFGVHDEGSC